MNSIYQNQNVKSTSRNRNYKNNSHPLLQIIFTLLELVRVFATSIQPAHLYNLPRLQIQWNYGNLVF